MRGGWIWLAMTASCAGRCPSTEGANSGVEDPVPAVSSAGGDTSEPLQEAGPQEPGSDTAGPEVATAALPAEPAGIVVAEWEWLEAAADPVQCARDAECRVFRDCCRCVAFAGDEPFEACGREEAAALGVYVNYDPQAARPCGQDACEVGGLPRGGHAWCVAGQCRLEPGCDVLVRGRQTGGLGRLDLPGTQATLERKLVLLRGCGSEWLGGTAATLVSLTLDFTVRGDGTVAVPDRVSSSTAADASRLELCVLGALNLNLVSAPPVGGAVELGIDLTFRRSSPADE